MGTRGRRWRKARRSAPLLALAVVGLLASACVGGSEDRLAKLKTDPMASYVLPEAVDSRTSEMAGGTSGVSSPSAVRTTFTVPEGGAADAIEEIGRAATDAGWVLTPRELLGFNGDKKIDGINAQIVIAGIDPENTVWVELSSRS